MSAPQDGGPAFPHVLYQGGEGMKLRDWFAGHALSGLLAADPEVRGDDHAFLKAVAVGAYAYADAMIAARGQK